ncbi:type 2 isopentenyl-diphosphate Delta-isomerase [Brevibacillus ginsengisoli]|uniref:type 2 isopentenyl-diphosphate Delta-isomerase n=1 Tax=Brevibacillus ginsengisoli TaxID=363854 RepID=UPI003CFA7E2B
MDRSTRKIEHIQHTLSTGERSWGSLDELHFIPNSLPNISYVNTDIKTTIADIPLLSPILINAMTGGAEAVTSINQQLAILAREKNLAMAVGSQMAAIKDPILIPSYRIVRKENPSGVLFANLGAEASVEQAVAAIEMIEANGLQIHLNVIQELLMPEGDRDFTGYLRNIERIVSTVPVPVIVKEVGFGMSRETIRQLQEIGVRAIDVGGSGGTNFARVENLRSSRPYPMFDDWGLTTLQSMLESRIVRLENTSIIASGGIRHGLDIAKALALGANAVGIAQLFLRLVRQESVEAGLEVIDELHHQLRIAMTALGAAAITELRDAAFTLSPQIESWAKQREI